MGTSGGILDFDGFTEDHPHAYGDKKMVHCLIYLMAGSSPRVWGQVKYT